MNKILIQKINNNKVNFNIYPMHSMMEVTGELGCIKSVFKGKDIIIRNNYIFIKSKVSFNNFLGLLKQKLLGVSKGYYLELCLVGLGYRFVILKNVLILKLGFSHYIKFILPKNIKYIGYKDRLIIFGLDFEEINRIGYKLKSLKLPDAYKGKGIRYKNEFLKLKVGKQK